VKTKIEQRMSVAVIILRYTSEVTRDESIKVEYVRDNIAVVSIADTTKVNR